MRSISRVEDVSINTVVKLLVDAGKVCESFHNRQVKNVQIATAIQCDELWSFEYARDRSLNNYVLKSLPSTAGSVWTFTALDSSTKLLLSCLVSKYRNSHWATALIRDLRRRLVDYPEFP